MQVDRVGGSNIISSLRRSDVREVGRVGPAAELLSNLSDSYRYSLVERDVGEEEASWAWVKRVRLVAGRGVGWSSRDSGG